MNGLSIRWSSSTRSSTETTLYVGEILEKVTKDSLTLWKHYVIGPTGLGALYIRRSNGTADTYYLTGDHLGSTDRIVRAATGAVQVAASFDAFGQRRASHWAGGPSSAELAVIGKTTRAGFTGQEMLDGVGLIHMNGRVYDPAVGRFLSVDPRVRDSAASQSWNGYAYVEARLLSATDPSGWRAFRLGGVLSRPNPPPPPTGPIRYRTTWEFWDIEIERGSIGDFMAMWGGVDNSLQASRSANEDAEREETQTQTLRDQARSSLCSAPAISYGLQLQLDLGLGGLGWQGSIAASFSTHGQFLFQAQGGTLFGLHAGGAVSLSPQVGTIAADPPRGWSDQSVYVTQFMMVSGPASAGYSLQVGRGSGQIGVEHGRVRLGPSASAGALVSASVGRQEGKQYASAGTCGQDDGE